MKKNFKKGLSILLAMMVVFCFSSTALAADKEMSSNGKIDRSVSSARLPDGVPAPHPNSEITVINFVVDQNGNAIVVDPNAPQTRASVSGRAGTATIYFTVANTVYWRATSKTGGFMSFNGYIGSNNSIRKPVAGISANGKVGGSTGISTPRRKTTTAALTGHMVDGNGISFTLPPVSTSIYVP